MSRVKFTRANLQVAAITTCFYVLLPKFRKKLRLSTFFSGVTESVYVFL